MARKATGWKTKGMNRDLSVSAFNPEFAFDNVNLRLSTNDDNTMMSWVNERGTQKVNLIEINKDGIAVNDLQEFHIAGIPIGTAIINHQLVLFTTSYNSEITHEGNDATDHIYLIKFTEKQTATMSCVQLYSGNQNFSTRNPLETLVSYEAETIQKVYWVDGRNQPRVINIASDALPILPQSGTNMDSSSCFDFVSTLQLNEEISVRKMTGTSGAFPPGVLQYAFTYYRRYGQESCIFYTTPLLYVSHRDRGASPDEKVENAFKISINNVDTNFDYIRIYSIQRTSINGTPICKRVQDIDIKNLKKDPVTQHYNAVYIDDGNSGDSVDPTELLYKGGEVITANTLEQKDSTLFFGGFKISRNLLTEFKTKAEEIKILSTTRTFDGELISSAPYAYSSQLTSIVTENNITKSVPCGGFKTGENYRLGVQFQYKTGKWSDPLWVKDDISSAEFLISDNQKTITVPIFKGTIEDRNFIEDLQRMGYKRVRAVVVFPTLSDRKIICQGVTCPTLFTTNLESNSSLYGQSSWFFRPYVTNEDSKAAGSQTVQYPKGRNNLRYASKETTGTNVTNPNYLRQVEIQGAYSPDNQFQIRKSLRTIHSPEVEFDDQIPSFSFDGCTINNMGYAQFVNTLSDINIQTETPYISNLSSGFVHQSFCTNTSQGIVAGLFYDDFVVDDNNDGSNHYFESFSKEKGPAKWMVYPWQASGSLNNDLNRPSDKGTATAILKKKIISNLRFAKTIFSRGGLDYASNPNIRCFYSDDDTIVKLPEVNSSLALYKGNIDTMVSPDYADGLYFASAGHIYDNDNLTEFSAPVNYFMRTVSSSASHSDNNGFMKWNGSPGSSGSWNKVSGQQVGNKYVDLVMKKLPVRIRYKSTPHLVADTFKNATYLDEPGNIDNTLSIVEVKRTPAPVQPFGGQTPDAFRANTWIPCGEPVELNSNGNTEFYYSYGDTYYQRYDCLKTYPFAPDDENQVVEIGSFMLETRVNIDGRYDRNRGQSNNLYMTPRNFNLLNPVYSQIDNFFSYKIVDDHSYDNTIFPNQVTWSKTKESGADVDLWTNMTLASVLELDGDKGGISKLIRLNDQLLCFQDSGISQILYNENVQIQSTDGVPIEIANSGKVQGKRYLSDTVGCSNKWSIVSTPGGIYFIDSNEKNIYLFNGKLSNLSVSGGFNSWSKTFIPAGTVKWTPDWFDNIVSYYDRQNQDVVFISKEQALVFSEKVGAFTSFYNYENTPYLCNIEDTGVWVGLSKKKDNNGAFLDNTYYLWKHQSGEYCNFFDVNRYYATTLICNPEPQISKIFTNVEFRACIDGEGKEVVVIQQGGQEIEQEITENTPADAKRRYKPYLPFDYLETWNEYQHGIAKLGTKNGHTAQLHHTKDLNASLKRKFRVWRCDVPRDNATVTDVFTFVFDKTFHNSLRASLDRMCNPWLYLRFVKFPPEEESQYLPKAEIHDMIMTYYL